MNPLTLNEWDVLFPNEKSIKINENGKKMHIFKNLGLGPKEGSLEIKIGPQ